MKTEKDKEIDDLFKKGLGPPDTQNVYQEGDWNALEQMLDGQKKRPVIVYWLPVLGSVAAVLLVVFGWWILKPIATHPQHSQKMAVNKVDTVTPGTARDHAAGKQQLTAKNTDTVMPPKAAGSKNSITGTNNNIANNTNGVSDAHAYSNKRNNPIFKLNYTGNGQNSTLTAQQIAQKKQNNNDLVAYNPPMVISEQPGYDHAIKPANYLGNNIENESLYIKRKNTGYSTRPQFAITVLAASDKNGVGSFQQTKPGNNVGVLFSMGLKRFTISTGATYDAKQYMSNFANYHTSYQFPTNPVSVLADCRMFDIPLNIDYRVFNSYRNKISIGTGISSYLMLHESYQYNYAEYGTSGPTHYNVPNPDKYLFSIVNFQATYERQINSNVGITLQPYLKLPLSGVGASQVRLQSTGLALGLTWNLNSKQTP